MRVRAPIFGDKIRAVRGGLGLGNGVHKHDRIEVTVQAAVVHDDIHAVPAVGVDAHGDARGLAQVEHGVQAREMGDVRHDLVPVGELAHGVAHERTQGLGDDDVQHLVHRASLHEVVHVFGQGRQADVVPQVIIVGDVSGKGDIIGREELTTAYNMGKNC